MVHETVISPLSTHLTGRNRSFSTFWGWKFSHNCGPAYSFRGVLLRGAPGADAPTICHVREPRHGKRFGTFATLSALPTFVWSFSALDSPHPQQYNVKCRPRPQFVSASLSDGLVITARQAHRRRNEPFLLN